MTGLEALKELRVIANTYCSFNGTQCEHNKELSDIIEKSLKALEIIKEKPQAELSLIQLGKIKTYEEYLDYTDKWELDLYGDMVYNEEEFALLRSVLGC